MGSKPTLGTKHKIMAKPDFSSILDSIDITPDVHVKERMFTDYVMDESNMVYWYSRIYKHVLTPETYFVPIGISCIDYIYSLHDSKPDLKRKMAFDDLVKGVSNIIEHFDGEAFIRSSHTSAKHDWKDSCFVSKGVDIDKHVLAVIDYGMNTSSCDMPTTIAVRRLIETTPAFHAFNEMPITKEYRLFIQDGRIVAWQPYWHKEVFKGHAETADIEKLDSLYVNAKEDIRFLMLETYENIIPNIHGNWSVDWLQSSDGQWYMIDMAEAHKSYVSPYVTRLVSGE